MKTNKCKVLLIEDDVNIIQIIRQYLELRDYIVIFAKTIQEARIKNQEAEPDLIILDILLPDGSGIELCREFRAMYSVPILYLTCLNHYQNIVEGLRAGGDDYLTKPFHLDELEARILALLRRIHIEKKESMQKIHIKPFKILPASQCIILPDETTVYLQQKEYGLFTALLQNQNSIVSAEDLYKMVWNDIEAKDTGIVRVHISKLRKKLKVEESKHFSIDHIHQRGYQMTIN